MPDNNGDGIPECSTDPACQYPVTVEKGCNCRDQIDNDNDGRTDLEDPDCAAFYGLEFIGDATDCSVDPPPGTDFFNIDDIAAVSGQNTVDTQSKMAIGDMDCDGISDVVATSKWNQTIRVIATTDNQADGKDAGDVKGDFKTPGSKIFPKGGGGGYYFELELAIADIDGDCTAEMFSIVSKRKNANDQPDEYFLVGFRYATKDLVPLFDAVPIGSQHPGIIGLTDFDADGRAEIYMKNRIYAAESGVLLADGGGDFNLEVNSAPVAIDIIKGGNQELVSGRFIYTVPNLSARTFVTMTVAEDLNTLGAQYFPKVFFDPLEYGQINFASTSCADVNNDGNIDVVVSGAIGSNSGPTSIFFWDVANGVYDTFTTDPYDDPTTPGVNPDFPNGWPWGTGRVNLGEIDGDGKLELIFIDGANMHALEESGGTLTQKWLRIINDSRSGIISTTVYDFNNDGIPEVVYRDSQQLAIIDGPTGATTIWSTTCQSHTMTEGPIIADVNNDGATDICVPCFRGPGGFDVSDPIQQQALGEIRLFNSSSPDAWLLARRVYNQAGYFIININDDLTLPAPMLDMTTIFSNETCSNGLPGPQKPYNTFLNQIPTLGSNGCPIYPGPDIAFVGNDPNLMPGDSGYVAPDDPNYFPAVEVIPPICGDLGIIVRFNVINDGARIITNDVGVSFWDGNPTTDAAAALLHTEILQFTNFQIGDTVIFDNIAFNSTGKEFDLYILLNDDGTNTPPFALEADECRIANNIFTFRVVPEPFAVDIEVVSNNEKCNNDPDNGEVRAQIFENGIEIFDYSKYGFQWFSDSTGASPITDPEGTSDRLTGRPEGVYGLQITNLEKGCQSVITDTTLIRIGADIVVGINELSPQSQCSPLNGELEAVITGDATGITYTWLDDLFNPIGVTGPTASNLVAGEYTVIATKSGCSNSASFTLDGPVFPSVTASSTQNIVDCNNLTQGAALATPLINGVAQDPANYSFQWFNYDTLTNAVGSTLDPSFGNTENVTGLTAGYYAVQVRDKLTQCESSTDTLWVQDLREFPEIQIVELAPYTACDPALANGILAADAIDGGVIQDANLYTFEWFDGASTLNPHTPVSGVNNRVAEGLIGQGNVYTVRVTNSNNCSSTAEDTVSTITLVPEISLVKVDNGVCDPVLGSSDYTGQITLSGTLGGVAITDFSAFTVDWYQGSNPATDPIIAGETGPVLDMIPGGTYTAVLSLDSVGCQSLPANIIVNDIPILPVIDVIIKNNTSCISPGNGRLTARVDIGGSFTTDPALYSFEWFDAGNNSISTSNVVSGLDGSLNYTVEVTNLITGCQSTQVVTLPDDIELPIVTLTATNNTVCDDTDPGVVYTGTVTATVTYRGISYVFGSNDMSGASFAWTKVSDSSNPTSANSNDGLLEQVNGDDYSVVVTLDSLGCASLPVQTNVNDVPTLPVVDVIIKNNTRCIAPGNGRLTGRVDLGGGVFSTDPALYEFEWFDSGNTSISTTNIVDNLLGGTDYTVSVKTLATGCINTSTITLPDDSELPVVTLTPTDNTVCDDADAGVFYTGTVTATVTYRGVSYVFGTDDMSGASFTWTKISDSSNPTSANSNNGFLEQVNGDDYSVIVTLDSLGCASLPIQTTVNDIPTLPTIDVVIKNDTKCSSPGNGRLTARVDLGGGVFSTDPSLYEFEWLDNTSASISNTNVASDLDGSLDYTIQVKELATGCVNTAVVTLPEDSEIPVVTLTPTDNTVCDDADAGVFYTGTVTATVTYRGISYVFGTDDMSGASFTWTKISDSSNPTSANSNDGFLEQVNGDDYSVIVTLDSLGCSSLPVQTTVNDVPTLPTIDVVIKNDTKCSSPGNGRLTGRIDLGGGVFSTDPSLYEFEWFDNTAASISNTNVVSDLDGSLDYTIQVKELATGCINTAIVTLPDDSELPQITLAKTDNTVCDDTDAGVFYTGTVTATVVYRGISYVFGADDMSGASFTYTKISDSSNPTSTNSNDGFLEQLNADDYSVVVTLDSLGCTSLPVQIPVADVPTLPAPDVIVIPNTRCAGGNNGIVSARVDEGGGVFSTDPSVYEFEWFDAASNSIGTTPEITGLSGNTDYTVNIKTLATGCVNTATVTLPDNQETPVVTLSKTDNSICDDSDPGIEFDGTVTANITWQGVTYVTGDDLSGVTFTWQDAALNPLSSSSSDPNVLDRRQGGEYFATISIDSVGCSSLPVSITVVDNLVLPVIDALIVSDTKCSSPGNGKLTSRVDLGGGTYSTDPLLFEFEWYDASNTLIYSTNEAIDLDGGLSYTSSIKNRNTGCLNTRGFTVPDDSEIPIISLIKTDNAVCDDSDPSVDFDGTVTATIDYQGFTYTLGDDFSGVTFNWDEGGTPLATTNADGSQLQLIDAGVYQLNASMDSTGCAALPNSITVNDVFTFPVIDILITDETTCTTNPAGFPNGALEARVDLGGGSYTQDPALYSFEWFDNTSTSIAGTPRIQDQNGNLNYEVVVTDLLTGCTINQTVLLPESAEIPVVTLAFTPNTVCDDTDPGIDFNGTITATMTYRGTSYVFGADDMSGTTFTWTKVSDLSNPTSPNSAEGLLEGIGPGEYDAVVFIDSVGCTSLPVRTTVLNNTTLPVIVLNSTDDTACDPSLANGVLSAEVDEGGSNSNNPADYEIIWHEGIGTGGPVVGTTTATYGEVDQLTGNLDYTVEVRELGTGCVSTASIRLQKNITIPTITIAETFKLDNCNTSNGELTATVAGTTATAGLEFRWYEGETTQRSVIDGNIFSSVTPGIGNLDGVLGSLGHGFWSVYAIDLNTNCVTDVVSFEILPPDIDINFAVTATPTVCTDNSGELQAIVNDPGTYTFEWYVGSPDNGSNSFLDVPPPTWPVAPFSTSSGIPNGTTVTVSSLTSGTYSLVITNEATGCRDYATQFVPFIDAHSIAVTPTPSTLCDPVTGNGEVFVDITNIVAAGRNETDYTFRIFRGTIDPGNQIGADIPGSAAGFTWAALEPNTYTVEVQENFGPGFCSVFETVEITLEAYDPIITSSISSSTFCGAPGNGEITLQADPDAADLGGPYTYTYTWAASTTTTQPDDRAGIATGAAEIWSALDPGDYTVTIDVDQSGCSVVRTFTILDEPIVPVTTDYNTTASNLCIPSGRIDVTEITFDGTAYTPANAAWADFEFRWFASQADLNAGTFLENPPGTPITDDFLDATNYPTMGAGTYYVKAIKTGTAVLPGGVGCETPPIQVVVNDNHVDPDITVASTPNTICDVPGFGGNGTITATANTGGAPASSYSWEIFDGLGISVGTLPGATQTETFTNLPPDDYTVVVMDDDNFCSISAPINVPNQPIFPNIINIDVTNRTLCSADDGTLTIKDNDIILGVAGGQPVSEYDLVLYNAAKVALPNVEIDNGTNKVFDGLAIGTYYIEAIKTTAGPGAGCPSVLVRADIQDSRVYPSLALSSTANTVCDFVTYPANGTLTATALTGGVSSGSYSWTITGAGSGFAFNAPLDPSNTQNITGLEPDTYTISIIDDVTGCTFSSQVEVPDNPVYPNVITITPTPQTFCTPDNGEILIRDNDISINGAVAPISEFAFQLLDASQNPLPDVPVETATDITWSNLPFGTYYVQVSKDVAGPGAGCPSPPARVDIFDQRVFPELTLSATANTVCDIVTYTPDGSLTATALTGGVPSATYSWSIDGLIVGNVLTSNIDPVNTQTVNNLAPDTYTVSITDDVTGCTYSADIVVPDVNIYPEVISLNGTNQTFCNPLNGTITVPDLSITINGVAQNNANLSIELLDDTQALITQIDNVAGDAVFNALGFGTYYIRATNNVGGTGAGCPSPPARIDLFDNRTYPNLVLSATSNTACDLVSFPADGSITATAATGAGTATTYTWTIEDSGATIVFGPVSDNTYNRTITGLAPDTYTVTIIDDDTGCSYSADIEVPDVRIYPDVITLDGTNQTFCTPANGTIFINDGDISVNGIPANIADFAFQLLDVNQNPLPDVPVEAGGTISWSALPFATYYIQVTKDVAGTGAGCPSPPARIDLFDDRTYPALVLSSTANTACDLVSFPADGSITASASTGGATATTYTWRVEDSGGNLVLPTVSDNIYTRTISNLAPDTYSVFITDDDTGCDFSADIVVPDVRIYPDVITLNGTDQTFCTPANGTIFINDGDINVNGIPANIADFDFQLLDVNQNPLPDVPVEAGGIITWSNLPFGTYYIQVTKDVAGVGAGCPSPPVRIDLFDNRTYPQLALSSTANTACDLVSFPADGSITATASTGGATASTYTWRVEDSGGNIVLPSVSDNIYTRVISNLAPDTYTVFITDDDTGCDFTAQVAVPDVRIYPDVITLNGTNQTFCNPADGTITINDGDISINGIPQNTSDLSLQLLDNNQVLITQIDNQAGPVVFSGLAFGTYYIQTINNIGGPGAGCPSPPARLDLFDDRLYPTLSVNATANTACDLVNFPADGTLTAIALTGGVASASYSWTVDGISSGNVFTSPNDPSNTQTITGLIPDTYTVTIIDDVTGCSYSSDIEVPDVKIYPDVVNITAVPQTTCDDNGQITVSDGDITINGVSQAVADLDLVLLDDNLNVLPNVPVDNGTSKTFELLAFGTYYVEVRRTTAGAGAGCPSPPTRVDLQDNRVFPIISFTDPTPNSACNVLLSNGSLTANAQEADGNTTFDYDFTWTFNGGPLAGSTVQTPILGTLTQSSRLDSIPEGDYIVTVTNPSTGCSVSAGYTLIINQSISEPNIIEVATVDPLDCNPSGFAEVTAISVGGSPTITDPVQLANDFTYEWYRDAPNVPANLLPVTTPSISILEPGTYYVVVTSLLTDCEGNAKEVIIKDDDIVFPFISFNEDPVQVSCDPNNPSARLIATMTEPDGQLGDYTFNWTYNGSALPPTIVVNENNTATVGNPAFSELDGSPAGTYTVTALNTISGCSQTATYIIEDNTALFTPRVSVSSTDLFNCVLPDGTISAGVVAYTAGDGYPYPNNNNYEYDWYFGGAPDLSGTPDFPASQTVAGLNDGTYTIKVTDLNTLCIESKVVEVVDGRVLPDVLVVQEAPLTNCDPARPNGQLTAIADGGLVSGYQFDWYNGTDTTGAPAYNVNNIYRRLGAGFYTVVVTKTATQCTTVAGDSIQDATLLPPTPDPELLKNMTSCLVPNGQVAASVAGNTLDYTFDWYDGSSVTNTPDFSGIIYRDRDIGSYTVTATDLITGCTSEGRSIEVIDDRYFPEYDFIMRNASCDESDGALEIVYTSSSYDTLRSANIEQVQWYDASGIEIGQGTGLYGYPAGEYVSVVRTSEGCETENTGIIGIDILTYNGISPNGDGSNDIWTISCITLFPNNNVKVFNRNGVKVYEANGYNNSDVSFDGVGINGTYLLGENLPDGTYFFIIDKGDGSKAIKGFLELLR